MADCTRRRGAARLGAAAVRRANGERAWVRCTRKVHPDARDVRRACSAGYARGVEAPRAGCSPPAAGPEPVQRQGGARSGQLRIGAKERRAGRSGPKRKVRPSGRRTRAASVARAMTSSERWAMSWNCCAEWLRGVAVRRVAGRTRIGVRVDVEEAVDAVDVGEERHAAPVPGKEYQKQQGAYVFQSFTHRTDGLGAKICFFCETERRAAPFRRPGRIFFRIRHFARAKIAASAAEVKPHFSEYSGAGGEPAGRTA